MSIAPDGPLCYCGQRGCVETYISGGGLEARYTERFGEKKPFKEIAKGYYAGDAKAVEFMKMFFRNFGRSLANLIDVLDPDVVVLGGGVSNFDALYTEGVAEVARYVFSDRLETPIVKHQLGDSAGVIGAALDRGLKQIIQDRLPACSNQTRSGKMPDQHLKANGSHAFFQCSPKKIQFGGQMQFCYLYLA